MNVLLNGYESATWLRSIAEQHPGITRRSIAEYHPGITRELLAVANHLDWLEAFAEKERTRYTEVQGRLNDTIREGLARERVLHDRIADLTNPGWRKPEPIKGDM